MPRRPTSDATPLSLAARKAAVEKIAENAQAKVRKGIAYIDFREPTAKERETGEKLAHARRRVTRAV